MTVQSHGYIPGLDGVLVTCDRCGFTKRRSQISKEWTNEMVCTADCLDPVPYEMSPPRVWPEGLPVPDARPVPDYIFIDPNTPPDPDAL
jgi:hypothetical protein